MKLTVCFIPLLVLLLLVPDSTARPGILGDVIKGVISIPQKVLKSFTGESTPSHSSSNTNSNLGGTLIGSSGNGNGGQTNNDLRGYGGEEKGKM